MSKDTVRLIEILEELYESLDANGRDLLDEAIAIINKEAK